MWTLLLVLVVFSVASSKRVANAFFGLAIGAVVLTGDSFFGPNSQGMFNPAVGTGACALSVFEAKGAHALWIYWVRVVCARPWECMCMAAWVCRCMGVRTVGIGKSRLRVCVCCNVLVHVCLTIRRRARSVACAPRTPTSSCSRTSRRS
jgi:hypothetical protein